MDGSIRWRMAGALVAAALAGCMTDATHADYARLREAAGVPEGAPIGQAAEDGVRALSDADTAALAGAVELDTVVRLALARSPEVREARARLAAGLEEVPAAARLPDLTLRYEQWGVPLTRPYAVHEAEMLMVGLQQTIPAGALLDARARVALGGARVIRSVVAAREVDVVAQVRRAYAAYYLADRTLAIHREHRALTERLTDVARAGYGAGRGSQQQSLALTLERARFDSAVAAAEADRRSAGALLNTLLRRAPDAPLGPPAEPPAATEALPREALLAALARRPELESAEGTVGRSEAELEVARAEAAWPEFMVGLDYMVDPNGDMHFYGAMVAMTLPWLNPGRGERTRAAEHTVTAERAALEAATNAARYELEAALARDEATRRELAILDDALMPLAERSVESARAELLGGQGDVLRVLDAVRTLWDVRLERVRTVAERQIALADVDRAAGLGSGGRAPAPERKKQE